jgi:Uma2 family endonuclease
MQHHIITQLLQERNAHEILEAAQQKLAEEAERRLLFYNEITEQEKAEFIMGEIIVHSPVRIEHNEATGLLYKLLDTYVRIHKLGKVGFEKILTRLTRNDYEPDICFFGKEKTATFKPKQTIFPAPDFVVEILSDSTAERDRGIKFLDYAAHQVAEYWIIDAEEGFIEQYFLKNGEYDLYQKLHEGEIESAVIEGFRIPVKAIFDEDINTEAMGKLF